MKQFISLVISFGLIYSSVLPSYAGIPPVGKIALSVERAAQVTKSATSLARISYKTGLSTTRLALLPMRAYVSPIKMSAANIISIVKLPKVEVAQAKGLMDHMFYAEHTGVDVELFLYNAVPSLNVLHEVAWTPSQKQFTTDFSRSVVRSAADDSKKILPTMADYEVWGKNFAAATNVGIYGGTADAVVLLEIAKKTPTTFVPYSDVIIGRSLLNLGAYDEFSQLVELRTLDNGLLRGAWWDGLKEYAIAEGLPVSFPSGIASVPVPTNQNVVNAIAKWSGLNEKYLDSSAKTTAEFLALKPKVGKEIAEPETMDAVNEVAPLQLEGSITTSIDMNTPNLQVASTDLPMGNAGADVVAVSPSAGQVAQSSESSFGLSKAKKFWKKLFNRGDNSSAVFILNKPQPLASQLRDIVNSNAARKYKEQALIKLYNQGFFSDFLAGQTLDVQTKITQAAATSDAELGEALFRLYDLDFLKGALQTIPSASIQGSLVENLENLVSQSEWENLARSAYEAEAVLPLVGSSTFNGTVPTVPEADLELIKGTFRPNYFAQKNQATPTGMDIDFYANNIPFYYRDSKGNLSASPVGILSQKQAGLFGRVLSHLHLASQPGFKIPKGFVLALDEQGQWKFVMPKGNLSIVEANKTSKKILEQMEKSGSYRVPVDTPYSTTDLLAMAHMLENNPELNLELVLNTPSSLNQFLKAHALFIGNDAGASLTGPFKQALKGIEGLSNTMANLVSGVGYVTPFAGGKMMPIMSKWGNVKTTNIIYGMAGTALVGSLAMGMNGVGDVASIPMWALSIPTVALVLGASLANSFIPTFLNFYKDPAARTAANLDFSTNKQLSRLALTGITALGAATGLYNWTVVVPVALGLLGVSALLFRNTPMVREASREAAKAKAAKEAEEAAFNALSPEEQKAKLLADQQKAENLAAEQERFLQEYKNFKANLPEMQSIKSRVSMVYASYAASLMVLGQTANEVLSGGWGQAYVAACMAATFGTRLLATKLVKNNKLSDDQLTGASLPLMAVTAGALALAPYSGPLAVATGLLGILHYMSTATPGQLDAARMQNIITAEMQKQKDDSKLTELQKKEAIEALTRKEKLWSAQASKDYSYYNGRGLVGIGVASAAAFLFQDLGPQWTQDILTTVTDFLGGSPSTALGRLLFGYTASVATVNAVKNWSLTQEFFRGLRKPKVTKTAISEGKITPDSFGIRADNADVKFADVNKKIKSLSTTLVDYGVNSEQKMTASLKQMIEIYNRLVALSSFVDANAIKASFNKLAELEDTYAAILSNNDISVMLRTEFGGFQKNMAAENKVYMPEGNYSIPAKYDNYVRANTLFRELDQFAYDVTELGNEIDYQQFVNYLMEAKQLLLEYSKANSADSVRAGLINKKLDVICNKLYKHNQESHFLNAKPEDSAIIKKAKQTMRDVLEAYK